MSTIEERVWLAERLTAALSTVSIRREALKRATESYNEAVLVVREIGEQMSAADPEISDEG